MFESRAVIRRGKAITLIDDQQPSFDQALDEILDDDTSMTVVSTASA
jgi:hypothetical protein